MSAFMRSMWPVRRDGLFLALAALAVGFYVLRAANQDRIGFPLDDSWIHQVYGRNLAERGEWAFVPGEPSAASTSPLYTVLLSIGSLLKLTPFVWAFLLGILALALGAMMAARIGETIFPGTKGVGIGTGLAVLLAWHMIWAAASGMETMLFMAFSLTVLHLAFRELDEARPVDTRSLLLRGIGLGAVGGLLTLTRPEGVGLVGLVGLFALISFGLSRRWGAWAVGIAVGWVILVTPYILLNYDLTGELLPSTADAKVAENEPFREDPLIERYSKMIIPLSAGAQLLTLPGIVYALWLLANQIRLDRRKWLLLTPAAWAFAHLTIFTLRLPAPYQHGRYIMPVLPPLMLYGIGGLLALVHLGRGSAAGRVVTRSLAISTAFAFPGFLWIGAGAYADDVQIINTEMVETAKWVKDNVPEEDLFAVHDIGALGYYAPRPILDLAGLVSPELVPIITDYPALMETICAKNARWLMVLPNQRPVTADDPRLRLVYESPYNFADQARGSSPEPWKMRVYAVECPGY
jgi:hypothetical protein